MYALDWQHQGYSFNPFLPFEKYGHPGNVRNTCFPQWRLFVFFRPKILKMVFLEMEFIIQYLFLVKKW